MIIIFEGFEKSGKTTLSKLLSNEKKYSYFRATNQINSNINLEQSIKHDWRFFLDFAKQCEQNVVIDRSFISQWVYSMILRKENILKEFSNYGEYFDIFANYCHDLNKLDSLVVFCKRENYNEEQDEHINVNKSKIFNETYNEFFKMFRIKNIIECNFEDGIQENLNKILEKT
jgi:hypothetical protein